MIDFEKTIRISEKGQITLPKAVRQALATEFVQVVIENGVVRIEPVPDVGGSLQHYASRYIPHEEARETVWSEVVDDQTVRH